MSRRLREKRNARARNVAATLANLRGADWDGMGCSYGAHDFEQDEIVDRCRRCGATYFRADVIRELELHLDPRHKTPAAAPAAGEGAEAAAAG